MTVDAASSDHLAPPDAPSTPIKATALSLEAYFRLGRLAPAAVQRDYRWRWRQCAELMDDLERQFLAEKAAMRSAPEPDLGPGPDGSNSETAADPDQAEADAAAYRPVGAAEGAGASEYYLGAIVARPSADGSREIYDGLQRSCALTVLIAVLRDLASSPALANRLDALIRDPKGRWRLELPGRDRWLRSRVQARGEARKRRVLRGRGRELAERRRGRGKSGAGAASEDDDVDLAERLREASLCFLERLRPWPPHDLAAFSRFVLTRVFVTLVEPQDAGVARRAFGSANHRGLALRDVEIVKGLIAEIAEDEATAKEIGAQWTSIERRLGEGFPDFLDAVDMIERRSRGGPDILALPEHLDANLGAAGVLSWVGQLVQRSRAWADMMTRVDKGGSDPADADLWRLGLFHFDEWRPLALLWHEELWSRGGAAAAPKSHAARAARRFAALHRRCLAVHILHHNARPTRLLIFSRALAQAHHATLERQESALNLNEAERARLRRLLGRPQPDGPARGVLLRWLEAERRAEAGEDPTAEGLREATVEHVLPQQPDADARWRQDFPDDKARATLCQDLGNLAVIGSDRLGNAEFAVKRKAYRDEHRTYRTLREAATAERWTSETVAAATAARIDEIEAALKLPARPRPDPRNRR